MNPSDPIGLATFAATGLGSGPDYRHRRGLIPGPPNINTMQTVRPAIIAILVSAVDAGAAYEL